MTLLKRTIFHQLIALVFLVVSQNSTATQLFAKGSISKTSSSLDKWTISITATGGIAFSLASEIHIEARYTNISSLQNKLEISGVGNLTDIKTLTSIYSLGLDINILGEKHAFQPFIFIGGGYIETDRSYYFTANGSSSSTLFREGRQNGISANVGLGFKIRIAKQLAFEVEAFGYSIDIKKPNPLINLYGNIGIRLLL